MTVYCNHIIYYHKLSCHSIYLAGNPISDFLLQDSVQQILQNEPAITIPSGEIFSLIIPQLTVVIAASTSSTITANDTLSVSQTTMATTAMTTESQTPTPTPTEVVIVDEPNSARAQYSSDNIISFIVLIISIVTLMSL